MRKSYIGDVYLPCHDPDHGEATGIKFDPSKLFKHPLRACSCGYDCRIVFSIEKDEETEQEVIVLLDVGTHDEVY